MRPHQAARAASQRAAAQARGRLIRAFHRSRLARRAATIAFYWRTRGRGYDLSHLDIYAEQDAGGPLQRDEALLLYALTRATRPRIIAEFGFLYGRSAFNFLQAMDPGAHLYSFDVSDDAAAAAADLFSDHPAFTFHQISQTDLEAAHVGGGPVDLVLLDAAHELELNQQTFARLEPLLATDGIVAVHDTGTWRREQMLALHHAHAAVVGDVGWLSEDEFQHQPDERRFVNWVLEDHGGFDVIHFHTTAVVRHGLTLLQRRRPLQVAPPGGP
jgi:predicted O-methyltransferase YrrM